MYDMVKTMPGPPKWKSETITLPDAPTEPQTLYYQGIVGCAHYLFKQSNLEANMDYVPAEVTNPDKPNDHCKWYKLRAGALVYATLSVSKGVVQRKN